jgi:uncharacterized membrane protein
MIDDRIEEGLSEEEAVSEIGPIDKVVSQTESETESLDEIPQAPTHKRKIKVWEIVLLILGAPLWAPLLIAAVAVIFSLYVVLWSLVISVWSIFITIAACMIGGLVSGIFFVINGNTLAGIAVVGVGIACAGLSIFLFFASVWATKGSAWLTKMPFVGIAGAFFGKGGLQK